MSDGVCREAEVSPDPHIWTQVGAGGRNSWIPVGFSWFQLDSGAKLGKLGMERLVQPIFDPQLMTRMTGKVI